MFTRFGLRFRMATSYMMVSALAVLVVEAILAAVFVSRTHADRNSILAAQQRAARAVAATAQAKAASPAEETPSPAVPPASVTAAGGPARSPRAPLADTAHPVSASGA